jgi:hypothetical protein
MYDHFSLRLTSYSLLPPPKFISRQLARCQNVPLNAGSQGLFLHHHFVAHPAPPPAALSITFAPRLLPLLPFTLTHRITTPRLETSSQRESPGESGRPTYAGGEGTDEMIWVLAPPHLRRMSTSMNSGN